MRVKALGIPHPSASAPRGEGRGHLGPQGGRRPQLGGDLKEASRDSPRTGSRKPCIPSCEGRSPSPSPVRPRGAGLAGASARGCGREGRGGRAAASSPGGPGPGSREKCGDPSPRSPGRKASGAEGLARFPGPRRPVTGRGRGPRGAAARGGDAQSAERPPPLGSPGALGGCEPGAPQPGPQAWRLPPGCWAVSVSAGRRSGATSGAVRRRAAEEGDPRAGGRGAPGAEASPPVRSPGAEVTRPIPAAPGRGRGARELREKGPGRAQPPGLPTSVPALSREVGGGGGGAPVGPGWGVGGTARLRGAQLEGGRCKGPSFACGARLWPASGSPRVSCVCPTRAAGHAAPGLPGPPGNAPLAPAAPPATRTTGAPRLLPRSARTPQDTCTRPTAGAPNIFQSPAPCRALFWMRAIDRKVNESDARPAPVELPLGTRGGGGERITRGECRSGRGALERITGEKGHPHLSAGPPGRPPGRRHRITEDNSSPSNCLPPP
ncbi:collagen alpha-1(I) chain-like [Vulpes lagopus]|uniref:collagen alpha-1(I) chain-like n=1 Tax=Vulpes lagopus TaxID=494514 RepID=UPI001BC93B77|nr:collagen alpha-1(I) chain-like [Vulpes lagopus]